ncbi:hypothetical protein [Pontibacter akesuensis]|uniref:hypothetical protein n=1 Tax=Pontibacter akesuensis TaxID=388950 RepID=UPI001114043C|nr:hypothetical protein [Pontibacter akesuensis]
MNKLLTVLTLTTSLTLHKLVSILIIINLNKLLILFTLLTVNKSEFTVLPTACILGDVVQKKLSLMAPTPHRRGAGNKIMKCMHFINFMHIIYFTHNINSMHLSGASTTLPFPL